MRIAIVDRLFLVKAVSIRWHLASDWTQGSDRGRHSMGEADRDWTAEADRASTEEDSALIAAADHRATIEEESLLIAPVQDSTEAGWASSAAVLV